MNKNQPLEKGSILIKSEFIAGKPRVIIIDGVEYGFYRLINFYNPNDIFYWPEGRIRKHYKHSSVGEQKELFAQDQGYAEWLREKYLKV